MDLFFEGSSFSSKIDGAFLFVPRIAGMPVSMKGFFMGSIRRVVLVGFGLPFSARVNASLNLSV